MEKVTIIVPVKDEEDGLNFLVRDYEKSDLKEYYDIEFIFVIDDRTSDSSREIASKLSKNIIDKKIQQAKDPHLGKRLIYGNKMLLQKLFS